MPKVAQRMGVGAGVSTRFCGNYCAILPLSATDLLSVATMSSTSSEQLGLHGHPFQKMNKGREQSPHRASVNLCKHIQHGLNEQAQMLTLTCDKSPMSHPMG